MKLSLSEILVQYADYRENNNDMTDKAKGTHPENTRQNFMDILIVMGLDPNIFKPSKNKPFQFAEQDRQLIFDFLDHFSESNFKLIRKGEYLKIPFDSLRSYLGKAATLLEHSELDANIILEQKQIMMRQTEYLLASELDQVKTLMKGIQEDLDIIIEDANEEADDTRYQDSIALVQDMVRHLKALRVRTRYVSFFMENQRENQESEIGLESFKQDPNAAARIKKLAQLRQALDRNEKYVALEIEVARLIPDYNYSRKKRAQLLKIMDELNKISEETQLREFGELLPHTSGVNTDKYESISSEDALRHANKSYLDTILLLQHAKGPGDNPISVNLVAQKFGDYTYKSLNGSMSMDMIFECLHALHSGLDWDYNEAAYEAYSAFSSSKQELFEQLIAEAAKEYKGLFQSLPELDQTELDMSRYDDIKSEICKNLEPVFKDFTLTRIRAGT